MIDFYLSDFILGIDNENQQLPLRDVVCEFEKLFGNLSKIKKNYKGLAGGVLISNRKNVCGYSLDEIAKNISCKELRGYILSILTKEQYVECEYAEEIIYKNKKYMSMITNQCNQNKGILIGLILDNEHINRLPYKESYITLMQQENYDYIEKYILLNDTFYLSQIYLDMLNSGYNLFFHIQAYKSFCEEIFISYSKDIIYRINTILQLNYFEDYDGDVIKNEINKIYAIRNKNPMYRIYFFKNGKNIYFLELTNNHNENIINKKLKSANKRCEDLEMLKDIFDIDDDIYRRKY